MAARTFLGTLNSDFNTAANWDGGVSLPAAADDLTIAANATLDADETLTYGTCTINATRTLNLSTYNFQCGLMTVNGTLTIGASGGTGLTIAGLDANAGSVVNPQTTSLITNSGIWDINNSTIWIVPGRGRLTQTGSSNFTNPANVNTVDRFTQNAGVTSTLTGNCVMSLSGSSGTTIDGTFALGANELVLGGSSGSLTIGAAADFTGTGILRMNYGIAVTTTWSRTSAISFTGRVRMMANSTATNSAIVADFSNSDYEYYSINGSAGGTWRTLAGTLKCKYYKVNVTTNFNMTIDNATNNPSFEISEGIDFKLDASTYTLTYTRGIGTMTLTGTSGTHNINTRGKTTEAIVLNCAGSIKEVAADMTILSLSGTAGTFRSNSAGTQRVVTVTNTGVASGCTFKDISMGAASRVNAKSSGVNLGNTLGIVFNDTLCLGGCS